MPPVSASHRRRDGRAELRWFAAALLLVAAALLATRPAPAQEPSLQRPDLRPVPVPRFETFDVSDGLAANEVDAILQDRRGFLWVGTWGGLERYDGASFTSFLHDPSDPRSLGNSWVWDLHEDRAGNLWVGTDGGLSRFDPATETFTNYRHEPGGPGAPDYNQVRAVVEDAVGAIWAGTQEGWLNRLDPATGTFTHHRLGPAGSGSSERGPVFALLADPDGSLWVGSQYGLSRFDPLRGISTRFQRDPADPASLAPPDVFSLQRDRSGALWVGTLSDGLYRLDPGTGTFTRYRADPSDPGALAHPWVLSLYEDREGQLWVGTDGGGLHRYDPAADTFVRYAHEPADPQGLSDDRVLSLYEDRAGVLWVGTHRGLNRRYPLSRYLAHVRHRSGEASGLSSNDVTAFLEDRTGALWVGTDGGGLSRRDPAVGAFTHHRHDPADPGSLGNDEVTALAEDGGGSLWVGTYDGLYRRDPRTGRFARFTAPAPDGGTWTFQPTTSLAYADGHLWVGTYDGLFDVDPRMGLANRYVPDPDDPTAPDYRYVLALLPERSGAVWVGTFGGGLGRLNTDTGAFTHLRHDTRGSSALRWGQITSIYRGRSGALWVGTEEGLIHLAGEGLRGGEGLEVTRYRQAEGLPGPYVNSILEDAHGRLWVTTVHGLSWFDPQGGVFRSYDANDGLPGGRVLYRSPHTGAIYVGGAQGYYAFDPADLGDEPPPAPVILTGLRLLGDRVRVGAEGSVLDRPMWMTEAFRLRHDDRVVTFGYAALDFRAPDKHRYAVRLDGFDEGWREVGGQREATFTNLSPGWYTFRVRVAGSDGTWNEEEGSVRLQVKPPWWRSGLAYALYALLAVGAAVGTWRGVRRTQEERVRRRLIEAEFARKTKELEAARALQLQLLPRKVPDLPTLRVATYMQTATEVGGDYYDFHCAEDGTLTVAIGDATGHGLRAGLMVAITKSLFQSAAGEGDLPQLLGRFNRQLKRMNLWNLFMAMALVRIHDGRLVASSAGMPPILVYRARTGEVVEVVLKGVPLGAFPAFAYAQAEVALDPGDTVVLMSDGLMESFDGSGEMLGWERVRAAFAEVGTRPPEEVVGRLSRAGEQWRGGERAGDDVTLVVVQRVSEPTDSVALKSNKSRIPQT